tara:strand:- start:777 stop:1514 length:738 start_codon:yes stop_codon:yes gene_type:complete
MSINLESVVSALRQQVLGGLYVPGEKLREVSVANSLNVSRTLARLAMSELEHEGLLVREPNRGTRVREFTIQEITDAIEVRGELEAMAVRLAAEKGVSDSLASEMEALLNRSEDLLASGVGDEVQREEWININESFHDLLVISSGNWAIKTAISQLARIPLVSTRSIIFDRESKETNLLQLQSAHVDHCIILSSILSRQGQRAEARMREHAYSNSRNKKINLANPDTMLLARSLPGGVLIAKPNA